MKILERARRYKIIFYFLLTITCSLLAGALVLGKTSSVYYYLGVVPGSLLGLFSIVVNNRRNALLSIFAIRESWGKGNNRKRDFCEIAKLFWYTEGAIKSAHVIDNQTWEDLNLDALYCKLDRTFTTPGEAVLYNILRKPCYEEKKLQEKAGLINILQKNKCLREGLQLLLTKLDRQKINDVTELLWGRLPDRSILESFYTFMAGVALLSLATPFFWGINSFFLIVGVFGLNSFVHSRVSRGHLPQLPAITYLANMLRTAIGITNLKYKTLESYQNNLKKASANARKILRKTVFLYSGTSTSPGDMLYEYINNFFLLEVRSFYATLQEIKRNRENLQKVYLIIGELDALQSIASYRKSLDFYVEPQFLNIKGKICLEMNEAIHPLIHEPIPNSITVESKRGLLITGSNMSGKSTFLRTVGINTLLAQTISTCLAKKYVGSFFRVISSISKADDLSKGKSFYFKEAERLLKLVIVSDFEFPTLCLIDEVLSGTNYLERLAASRAILEYLALKNALTIVATHDLDLANYLQENYSCYYFTDNVDRNGLNFDYCLRKGVSTSSNAIKLLGFLGYPAMITDNASKWVAHLNSRNSF